MSMGVGSEFGGGTPPVGTVGDSTALLLCQTRPWVRFFSILGFIGAGMRSTGTVWVASRSYTLR